MNKSIILIFDQSQINYVRIDEIKTKFKIHQIGIKIELDKQKDFEDNKIGLKVKLQNQRKIVDV